MKWVPIWVRGGATRAPTDRLPPQRPACSLAQVGSRRAGLGGGEQGEGEVGIVGRHLVRAPCWGQEGNPVAKLEISSNQRLNRKLGLVAKAQARSLAVASRIWAVMSGAVSR